MSATSMQSWGGVVLESYGAYATIRMDRPEKRNAMNREARQGMLQALRHAEHAGHRAIVLTGTGTAFCAGIDLKERKEDVENGNQGATREWADVNVAIRQHPAIFIAAVNGTALGGGGTLINMCDLAIAAEHVEIGMPEITFGVYPALAGPAAQLTISRKRAAWMVLTGERVDARTALAWGLVNQVVDAATLLETALALAERVSHFDAVALAASKRALDRIPATITDWRQAFEFGELINNEIRLHGGNGANPFAKSLPAKAG